MAQLMKTNPTSKRSRPEDDQSTATLTHSGSGAFPPTSLEFKGTGRSWHGKGCFRRSLLTPFVASSV
jgi:hypothetical protein